MNMTVPTPLPFSNLKFDIQNADRIRVDDFHFTLDRHLERAYLLQTDDARRLRQSFGHREFYDLLLSGRAEIDRNYYSGWKAEKRSLFGGCNLESFSDENVSQAEFYQGLIDLFDSRFGEGRYCGEKPLGEVLLQLTDELQGSDEYRRQRSGTKVFRAPLPRTFQRRRSRYHECEGDVMSLLRLNGGSKAHQTIFEPDMEDLVQGIVEKYQSPLQPSIEDLFKDDLPAEIHKVNKEREAAGLPLLDEVVTKEEFRRRIHALDKFETLCARRGADYARRACAITNKGFRVYRPGERLEVDEWTADMVKILTHLKLWKRMTKEQQAKVPRGRVKVIAVIDVATRFIAALRICLSPTARDAVAVLRMVVTDKSYLGAAVGAQTLWPPLPYIDLFHDQSKIYMNALFARAGRSLRGGNMAPPAGDPMGRPFIEAVFKTFGRRYMRHFPGRTFWSTIAKGDYDPTENAAMLADEVNRDMVRAVVDVYHNTRHSELAGETPWNTLVRLTQAYSVPPLPSDDQLRHIFGVLLTRQLTRDGIEVFGIRYQSAFIQKRLLGKGTRKVNLRFDKENIEAISVEIEPGAWVTVPNAFGIPRGVGLWEWLESDRALEGMNAEDAEVYMPIRLDGINALRESGWSGAARAGIGLDVMTDKQFDNFEQGHFRRARMTPPIPARSVKLAEIKPPAEGVAAVVPGVNDDIDAEKILRKAERKAKRKAQKAPSPKRKENDVPRDDDLGSADDVKFR